MGLFGFGNKKTAVASANDIYKLKGPAGSGSAQCLLLAGIRGIELQADLSADDTVTLTHGPVTLTGVSAIETYLDIKGQGAPLKPKKARHLGEQNRWIEISNQLLDQNRKVDQIMQRMNEILAEQEFLAGPLTQADAHVAGSVLALKKSGQWSPDLSNVEAWLKRLQEKIPENLRASVISHIN